MINRIKTRKAPEALGTYSQGSKVGDLVFTSGQIGINPDTGILITENFKVARRIRNECDFGLGYWNGGSIAAESHLGFGGVKKSGNGQPSAARTFRSVTHEVSWTVNHGDSLNFPQGMKTGTDV